jgi:RimJ/RimL family protein N-acetyltransferase
MTHDLPDPLPDAMLEKRGQLPLKPDTITLEGRFIRLVPYDEARDAEALYTVSNGSAITLGDRYVDAYDADELIWRWMFKGPFSTFTEFADYMRGQHEAANALPFTVFHIESGRQIGVANYLNNVPDHLKIELGSIWYSPVMQRTPANAEATYLMTAHAFALGYRRVEWKCNALNLRSRRSAERMGFTFEGIQEAHMIVKNRNRDTAWFRILRDEWFTSVQSHLERLIENP